MVPEENAESMQILRYIDGQKYEPHTDSFHDKYNSNAAHGGQRFMTVLTYLSTPDEGGETVFPYATPKVSGPGWSECATRGLAVKAIKGNAIIFFSLNPDGTEDITSTHGSCPILAGEKWSATKWVHVSAFNKGTASSHTKASGACRDEDERCQEWASHGEVRERKCMDEISFISISPVCTTMCPARPFLKCTGENNKRKRRQTIPTHACL
jgi:prolyl 4-hydroxylase